MNKKRLLISSLIIILFIAIITMVFSKPTMSVNTVNTNRAVKIESTKTDLKVLVVQIDPYMKSITNEVLYPNDGHPRVSDYLNGVSSNKKALEELIEDIEYSSNNYIHVDYTLQEIDEYLHYAKEITLSNGTKSKFLDEETIIKYANGQNQDSGSQKALIEKLDSEMITNSIDYEYYINKLELDKKRNNDEFDQVWFLTYEPTGPAEVTIIGNRDLDVNGTYVKSDCLDFVLATVTAKNRNSNFHHLLHALEAVLNKVFKISRDDFNKENKYEIYTANKLEEISLWERFTLSSYSNNKDFTGLGTLHYPPNAEKEYEYNNKSEVKSEYLNWKLYPNLESDKRTRLSQSAWNNDDFIDQIINKDNLSEERLYTRWWASHLPNTIGATKDGYYNNWWKYLIDLDYVTSIMVESSTDLEYNVNDKLIIKYILGYDSGTFVKENEVKFGENVVVSDSSILSYEDGWIVAKKAGDTLLTVKIDNYELTYNISIKEGTAKKTTEPASEEDDVLVIGGKPQQPKKGNEKKEEEVPEVSPETDEESAERTKMYIIFGVILFFGLVASIFTYRITSTIMYRRDMYNYTGMIVLFLTILLLTGCGKKEHKTTYYCEEGYTLVGEICSKRIEEPAKYYVGCPEGYDYYDEKLHRCGKLMSEEPYYQYVCPADYTLNNRNECDGFTHVKAEQVYYCVSGELNEKAKVCEHITINNKFRSCNPKCERGKANAQQRCEETFAPTPGVGCPSGENYRTLSDGQCYYSAEAECNYTCTSPYTLRNGNCVYIDKTTKANQRYDCKEGTLVGNRCTVPATKKPSMEYSCDSGKYYDESTKKCTYYEYKTRDDLAYCDEGYQLEGDKCIKIETKNAMSK